MDIYRLLLHEAGGAPGYCIRRRRAGAGAAWDGGGDPWEADATGESAGCGDVEDPREVEAIASNGKGGGKTGEVARDGEDPCEADAIASNGKGGGKTGEVARDGEDPCEADAIASNGKGGGKTGEVARDGEDPCEADAIASNGKGGGKTGEVARDGEDPCEADAIASNGKGGGKTGEVARDGEDPCEADASVSNGEDGGKTGQVAGDAEDKLVDMGAASDIFLVQRRTGGVAPSWVQTIRHVRCSYWIDAAKRWVNAKVFGRVEAPLPPKWSWTSIMGPAVYQPHRHGKGDGSCVICACAVCIHAQHRLAFERRYGAGSFPYDLSSVDYLRDVCQEMGIWKPWSTQGTDPTNVLAVIKDEMPEGLRTSPVPGWRACNLPFRGHFALGRKEDKLQPNLLAALIRELGPVVGTLRVNKRYSTVVGRDDVYRGEAGDPNHTVVCVGYRFVPRNGELRLRVLDNARQDGPLRWVLFAAFTRFFFIEVDALDRDSLLVANANPSLLHKMFLFWK